MADERPDGGSPRWDISRSHVPDLESFLQDLYVNQFISAEPTSAQFSALSNRVSAISTALAAAGSVTSNEMSVALASVSQQVSALSQAISVVSQAISVETAARISAVSNISTVALPFRFSSGVSTGLSISDDGTNVGIDTRGTAQNLILRGGGIVQVGDIGGGTNITIPLTAGSGIVRVRFPTADWFWTADRFKLEHVSAALTFGLADDVAIERAGTSALRISAVSTYFPGDVNISGNLSAPIIDTLSNAISVLSNQISALSQSHSALSNAVSVLSNQLSALSQAVSVISQQVSILSQQLSVLSQSVSSQAAALSIRIDTQSQSISVLSNQVSVLSNAVSALSQAVSVVSNAVSIVSANVVSVLSVAQAISADLTSTRNVLSNQISVLSQQLSVVSQKLSAIGAWRVVGVSLGVSANTLNMAAEAIQFYNPTNRGVATYLSVATVVNNTGLSAGVDNGRDQAGAFTSSTWVHLYFVLDGTTVKSRASLTTPPNGPTLQGTEKAWAYVGPVFMRADNTLRPTRINGAVEWFDTDEQAENLRILAAGTASVWTTISPGAGVIPSNCRVLNANLLLYLVSIAIGNYAANVRITGGAVSAGGSGFSPTNNAIEVSASTNAVQTNTQMRIPTNASGQFDYEVAPGIAGGDSRGLYIDAIGFVVPNGDN